MIEAHQPYERLRDLPLPELLDVADHVSRYLGEKNSQARADADARRHTLYDEHDRPIAR